MRTTVASGKRHGREMGTRGAPATGLMHLWAPEPAAMARAQAGVRGGRQPLPSCPTAARKRDPNEGKEEVGNAKKMVVQARLK